MAIVNRSFLTYIGSACSLMLVLCSSAFSQDLCGYPASSGKDDSGQQIICDSRNTYNQRVDISSLIGQSVVIAGASIWGSTAAAFKAADYFGYLSPDFLGCPGCPPKSGASGCDLVKRQSELSSVFAVDCSKENCHMENGKSVCDFRCSPSVLPGVVPVVFLRFGCGDCVLPGGTLCYRNISAQQAEIEDPAFNLDGSASSQEVLQSSGSGARF